ncbi:MAG TPA: hypothetical protein VLA77_04915 [Candidatus Saccharimonadales bacterium]|nr:hypothetical protein [Candidatus Saccharimonadales bacterium]
MKQILNDNQLQNMTVPTVELSHHQAQLRHVLVSRAATKANKITILGVIKYMNKRFLIGASAVGVFALAVVMMTAVNQSPASAMQLARDSSAALQSIGFSDKDVEGLSEQEITYKKYIPQFLSWLGSAQKASDLKLLSYDEVLSKYPDVLNADSTELLRVIDNPQDGESPKLEQLRYLEFTLHEGEAEYKIVVGVNQNDVPEAAMMKVVTPGKSTVNE